MNETERKEYKKGQHWEFHNALLAMGALTSAEADRLLVTDQISVMLRSSANHPEFHASVLYGGTPGWTVNEGFNVHVDGGEFEEALAVFAQLIDDRRK